MTREAPNENVTPGEPPYRSTVRHRPSVPAGRLPILRRERWRFLSAALLVMGLATCAASQEGLVTEDDFPQGATFNPDAFGPLPRLRNAIIVDLLKLSAEQRKAINGIQRAWARDFTSYVQTEAKATEAASEKLRELLDDYEKKSLEALTKEQQIRLVRLTLVDTFHPSLLRLLRSSGTQRELRLNTEQKAAIRAFYVEYLKEGEDFLRRLPDREQPRFKLLVQLEPFRDRFQRKAQNLISRAFTEPQQRRFSEIELQRAFFVEGPRVLLRTEIVKKLHLTKEQQEAFRDLDNALSADPAGRRFDSTIEYFRKACRKLSEKQMSELRECLGKPHTALRLLDE